MAENRDREIDIEAEDTLREEGKDEPMERSEERTEERRENRVSEQPPATDTENEELMPLFEDEAAKKFRTRWLAIQSKFVDDPRDSVKQADDLVADIIKSMTMSFADRRISLEKQWNSGDNVSTEDMRLSLKRYRSFFERLLALES